MSNAAGKKFLCIFVFSLFIFSLIPSVTPGPGFSANDVTSFKDTLITTAKDYTTAGYDFDKVEDPIFYKQEVLCEGHLPLALDIETTKEFSLTDNDKNNFLKSSEVGKTNIGKINYKYNILMREDFSYIVPHYKLINTSFNEYDEINNTWDNYSKDISTFNYNETVNDFRYIWKDIIYLEKIDFKTTNKIIVDVVGTFKAELVKQEIDIIPDIKIGDYTNSLNKYAWWSSSWEYKKEITIDNTKVSGSSDLTNFPILVKIDSDSDIGAECQNDLDDISFTNSAEDVQLDHEIESYSFSGDSLTAYIWVEVPTLDHDDDTKIYLYYGNDAAVNQEDVTGTWSNSYLAVWHMAETSGDIDDSTGSYDAAYSGTPLYRQTGAVGYGIDLDANTDNFVFSDTGYLDGDSDFTISVFANSDVGSGENWLIQTRDESYTGFREKNGNMEFVTTDAGGQDNLDGGSYNTGQFYYHVGVYDANVGKEYYLDTSKTSNSNYGSFTGQTESNWIGSGNGETAGFDGTLDEVRISTVIRTSDWITTVYNSIDSPSTFLSFGGEQVNNISPEFKTPLPTNGSTGQDRPPVVSIIINDDDGDIFNVTWYSNSSGSWQPFGYNNSVTNNTFYQTNNNFSTSNITYYWNVSANDGQPTGANNNSGVYHFTTKEGAQAPTNWDIPVIPYANCVSHNTINMTWTQGINATHTRIQRKTGSRPASISDGTNVYNGTGELYSDTSLTPGTPNYYYRAWSWNNTLKEWVISYAEMVDPSITTPLHPATFTVTVVNTTKINLTWTMGEGAEKTIIRYQTGSYPTHVGDGDSAYLGTDLYTDITSLTPGTTYYFRAWGNDQDSEYSSFSYANGTGATSWVPSNVTNLFVNTSTYNNLNLSWVNGNGTHTVIRYDKTNYPTGTSDGTLLLNDDTGLTSYQHTDLNYSEDYFYRIWSCNTGVYSIQNESAFNWTRPQVPQNATGTLYSDALNITWDNATGGDMVILLKKSGSYPTNITDGMQLCNYSTHTRFYNLTHTSGDYYALWSYDNSTNLYSSLYQLLWGGLQISVYDENTSAALTWDIFITNAAGSETKEYTSLTNPSSLDINIIPNGDDTALILSAPGHRSRTYYMNLIANNQYTVNAYLPKINESELYLITVNNEFDVPVETARVVIRRAITGSFVNVSSVYTDANGQISVYLMPDVLHKFTISKEYYSTKYTDWFPDDIILTKTFKITHTLPPDQDSNIINEIISFDAYFNDGDNYTLFIEFADSSELNENAKIFIYQNGTDLINTTTITNSSHNFNITGVNHSLYEYKIVLLLYSHSYFNNASMSIIITNWWETKSASKIEIDLDAILGSFGAFSIGWVNVLVFFLGVFILVTFGRYWAGLGLIALGLVIALVERVIGLPGFTGAQFAIIAFVILLGAFVEILKAKRSVRL